MKITMKYLKEMNDKQRENHLKNNGHICPFCKSDQIEGKSFDIGDYYVYQNISCMDCKKEWTDQYELINVFEI